MILVGSPVDIMGLVASSCMSSSAISSAVFAPINKKKKHREVFPQSSATQSVYDDKLSAPFCKQPRRKDKTQTSKTPQLKIDVTEDDDEMPLSVSITICDEIIFDI